MLELPCVGYCDDYRTPAPLDVVEGCFAGFANVINGQLKQAKSAARSEMEFLSLTVHFTESNPNSLAEILIAAERVQKLSELVIGLVQAR